MLPGVIRTRVGYTGGTTKSPSYYKIGDHTESFQVDFDPTKTSYEKILQVFWSTHNHWINKFYLAESYHQKYLLKQVPLLARDMKLLYPKDADFLNSTAATRINGFVGGHGSQALLQEEIDGFGLTPQGRELLSRIVQQYGR
jgi:peptide-methionine (S)-S-oxide reductase